MGIPVIGGILSGILDIGRGFIEGEKAKQEKKLEMELRKIESRAEIEIANQKAATGYDLAALEASKTSWKDEYLTVLITLPVIGSFIPGVQDSVLKGWEYLDRAPGWFQLSFIGIIAATFGLRWLFSRGRQVAGS